MSPLNITTRNAPDGPVLEIVGDLDYATAGRLRELLATLTLRPGQRLVLDLAGMEFCDSSGITALIVAHNQAQAARAGIALTGVPGPTLRVLRLVGLDQIFALDPDSGAADGPDPSGRPAGAA
ncbi:Anti-sigma-B factor antagonist [Streptomyces sp. enrichment culture]|uniref:STAS domain-containing protein n=1 Tax=Streptomyces sp. enrichment culture TaxID=1795815 RepID=UPI003F553C59